MEASSPSYGSEGETRNHRDAAEHISSIEKENFNLKLRIYHMEEHLNSNGGQDFQSILQQKVEVSIRFLTSRLPVLVFWVLFCDILSRIYVKKLAL